MARGAVTPNQTTSAQQLASVIKCARDIMRKDKGLSGDLDRLPMLTWIMFLKFLDDMEQVREAEAALEGKPFRPAIEPPYRWRDWAANPGGITGDELIAFVNQDEAVRPDGNRGAGLFAYLRSLHGADGGDRRDVIANVFRGTINRMINGYLLRDVINKVSAINFRSSDGIHTLGMLYESMLKEMRDAAGDSGEFYTPRPVVRFIATVIDPRLGETILDPAAGTGGFLLSAFEHLQQQCRTVEDHERLQRGTLFGIEAKPLPYLLCQMNLLLHGLEYPEIDYGNALRFPLREIGDRERVDIIMTNPPFGGEEERGILGNFPEDKQTSETALLFLQLIMRKLRRPAGGYKGGRCGMVVPNGVLFGDGVCARIKEELLKQFNLHTIVRLPNGVFAPYTSIPTNLLFFDRFGPTKDIWYYEHPLPEGRKSYSKTQPLVHEELEPCLAWWRNPGENDHAWRVPAKDVLRYDDRGSLVSANLDIQNPNRVSDVDYLPPEEIADDILEKEQRIAEIIAEIHRMLARYGR
jgi:type I restriction enzyme M protein